MFGFGRKQKADAEAAIAQQTRRAEKRHRRRIMEKIRMREVALSFVNERSDVFSVDQALREAESVEQWLWKGDRS